VRFRCRAASYRLSVFEVQDRVSRVGAVSVDEATFEPWDHVVGEITDSNLFDFVDFDSTEANIMLVFAELPTIEYVEDFIPFHTVWCPIMN